jgi:hypothetical protein
MKKIVLLSIGMLALALPQANASTVSLFTTYDDFSAFTAGWGAAPSANNSFSTDASTVNGIGNLSNAGGAGTSGSLLVAPGNGWFDAAGGPSQGGNPAFLSAIDPGYANDNNSVAYSGNLYMDYSVPDNEGGATFQMGVLFQYAANGYFGTFFSTTVTDLGYQDPNYGEEVYRATIPYTITAGQFTGFGFGIMVNTDYNPALPFYVDKIAIDAVPEPGVIALTGLGLAGLTLIRRRHH